jgi:hypothetical protein
MEIGEFMLGTINFIHINTGSLRLSTHNTVSFIGIQAAFSSYIPFLTRSSGGMLFVIPLYKTFSYSLCGEYG